MIGRLVSLLSRIRAYPCASVRFRAHPLCAPAPLNYHNSLIFNAIWSRIPFCQGRFRGNPGLFSSKMAFFSGKSGLFRHQKRPKITRLGFCTPSHTSRLILFLQSFYGCYVASNFEAKFVQEVQGRKRTQPSYYVRIISSDGCKGKSYPRKRD